MMTTTELQAYLDKTIARARETIVRLTQEIEIDAFTTLSMRGDELARAAAEIQVLTRWQKVMAGSNPPTVEQVKADALDKVLYLSSDIAETPPSSPSRRLVRNMTLAVWTDLYKRIG